MKTKTAVPICRIPVLCFPVVLALAFPVRAGVECRVRTTPAGPRLFVDGKPVPARMFWGRPGGDLARLGSDWRHFRYPFVPIKDVERGTVHFRFQLRDGRVEMRNLAVVGGGVTHPLEFGRNLDVWPKRPDYPVSVADGVLRAGLHGGPDDARQQKVDLHLHSALMPFEGGRKYVLEFDARAEGIDWIRPQVWDFNSDGTTYDAIGFSGEKDVFSRQIVRAREAGVRFITFRVPCLWPAPDVRTDPFAELDALCDLVLRAHPKALLVPRVNVNAPGWWLQAHPDSEMVSSRSRRMGRVSISDRTYRREAKDMLASVCRHLMERYPDSFAGLHFAGASSEEFFFFRAHDEYSGYDRMTQVAYRQWLKKHGDAGWETAETPLEAARAGIGGLIGTNDVRTLEFNRFLQYEMASFVGELAQVVRRETKGEKLSLCFYGYGWEFAHLNTAPACSGHYGLGRLLRHAENLDMLCGPVSYYDRGLADGRFSPMGAAETVMRAGVLWMDEVDLRTHLYARPEAHMQEGDRVNEAETLRILRTCADRERRRGFGSWWMDLPAYGSFDCASYWELMKEILAADRADIATRSAPFVPRAALVIEEDEMMRVGARSWPITGESITRMRGKASRQYDAVGQYLLEDIERNPLPSDVRIIRCRPETGR